MVRSLLLVRFSQTVRAAHHPADQPLQSVTQPSEQQGGTGGQKDIEWYAMSCNVSALREMPR